MLKTTTKKAKGNLKAYIRSIYRNEELSEFEIEGLSFGAIAADIYSTFLKERHHFGNIQADFVEWSSGLPPILDCSYYLGSQAINDLGDILEETEEERQRYTAQQAEQMLSKLIFRVIKKETDDLEESSYCYKWALYVNYGCGWEYELYEESLAEVKQQQRAYRINCPQWPTKIAKERIPLK